MIYNFLSICKRLPEIGLKTIGNYMRFGFLLTFIEKLSKNPCKPGVYNTDANPFTQPPAVFELKTVKETFFINTRFGGFLPLTIFLIIFKIIDSHFKLGLVDINLFLISFFLFYIVFKVFIIIFLFNPLNRNAITNLLYRVGVKEKYVNLLIILFFFFISVIIGYLSFCLFLYIVKLSFILQGILRIGYCKVHFSQFQKIYETGCKCSNMGVTKGPLGNYRPQNIPVEHVIRGTFAAKMFGWPKFIFASWYHVFGTKVFFILTIFCVSLNFLLKVYLFSTLTGLKKIGFFKALLRFYKFNPFNRDAIRGAMVYLPIILSLLFLVISIILYTKYLDLSLLRDSEIVVGEAYRDLYAPLLGILITLLVIFYLNNEYRFYFLYNIVEYMLFIFLVLLLNPGVLFYFRDPLINLTNSCTIPLIGWLMVLNLALLWLIIPPVLFFVKNRGRSWKVFSLKLKGVLRFLFSWGFFLIFIFTFFLVNHYSASILDLRFEYNSKFNFLNFNPLGLLGTNPIFCILSRFILFLSTVNSIYILYFLYIRPLFLCFFFKLLGFIVNFFFYIFGLKCSFSYVPLNSNLNKTRFCVVCNYSNLCGTKCLCGNLDMKLSKVPYIFVYSIFFINLLDYSLIDYCKGGNSRATLEKATLKSEKTNLLFLKIIGYTLIFLFFLHFYLDIVYTLIIMVVLFLSIPYDLGLYLLSIYVYTFLGVRFFWAYCLLYFSVIIFAMYGLLHLIIFIVIIVILFIYLALLF